MPSNAAASSASDAVLAVRAGAEREADLGGVCLDTLSALDSAVFGKRSWSHAEDTDTRMMPHRRVVLFAICASGARPKGSEISLAPVGRDLRSPFPW